MHPFKSIFFYKIGDGVNTLLPFSAFEYAYAYTPAYVSDNIGDVLLKINPLNSKYYKTN